MPVEESAKQTDMIQPATLPLGLAPEAKRETYWDAVALTRWGRYLTELERRLVAGASESAGAPSNGIDLGCGSGRWSRQLADAGWRMTCIDAAGPDLDVCRQNVPEAQHILVTPETNRIPCPMESAGILICIEVGPVIDSDWFIPETARVLAKNGVAVGVMCNRNSWRGITSHLRSRHHGNFIGYRYYQRGYAEFRRRLIASGFEMLHQEGFCWGPASRSSDSALVPFYSRVEKIFQLNRMVTFSPWVAFIARKL